MFIDVNKVGSFKKLIIIMLDLSFMFFFFFLKTTISMFEPKRVASTKSPSLSKTMIRNKQIILDVKYDMEDAFF